MQMKPCDVSEEEFKYFIKNNPHLKRTTITFTTPHMVVYFEKDSFRHMADYREWGGGYTKPLTGSCNFRIWIKKEAKKNGFNKCGNKD